ncbi:SOS response-associated peptidase family protein [Burkholderia cepacia]|uniref:SOS response-associated peptidase family protein n=1 Tax=Burkholderia cepacia TaxID=292 RepID=UPI000753ECED|nr:SOS response-associated peptidase family protein [Burkholderia cepacia]KWD57253.1 hypothetical protein WL68_02695 [Burkholderia cepacia]KWD83076.1 hypothetical protein WL69_15520 [Burkholderia cepacia]MCA7941564.1 SOS response-associated peptidase [Burkholderia cepacia]
MCTNYKAPNEDPGINELKIGIGDLFRRDPWDVDVWPDYRAPAILPDGDGSAVTEAVFGFWPKFMQPDRLDEKGKKRKKFDTVNARGEEVAEKRLYQRAWRDGQRCLIPAQYVVEPSYPHATQKAGGGWDRGPCVWQRIGLADWSAYCVAGIWRRYQSDDGRVLIGMTMLTLNADEHPLFRLMHRPEDEKRGVVMLRPADYDEWLHTKNVEAARAMLQLYPADEMAAAPDRPAK